MGENEHGLRRRRRATDGALPPVPECERTPRPRRASDEQDEHGEQVERTAQPEPTKDEPNR